MTIGESEEFIFIIDLGDVKSKMLFAHFDASGQIDLVDTLTESSVAIKNRLPSDIKQAGAMVTKMKKVFEERHELDIQTVFCLLKGEILRLRPVKEVKPYVAFLDNMSSHSAGGPSALPAAEIPPHEELVDVYDCSNKKSRVALSLAASPREWMQNTLFEAECFLEGFIAPPRVLSQQNQDSRPRLWLDFYDEGSSAYVLSGQSLLLQKHDGFSLETLVKHFSKRFSVSTKLIRDVLEIEMRPTASMHNDWEEKIEAHAFLNENLSAIKDEIALCLERYVMTLRSQLDGTQLFDVLSPKFTLSGPGAPLFKKYVFLRDILPLESESISLDHIPTELRKNMEADYSELLALLPHAYKTRKRHREQLQRQSKLNRLSEWSRRLLGR